MPTITASRRRVLGLFAAGAGGVFAPRIAFADAATDRRFVFIIQRGAADGLDIVAPYADPAYARLRGALAIDASTTTRLDGLFVLHPALVETARLYAAREALFVHAVASPYRDRSHFDGQNVLESGGLAPYDLKDGWLNRLIALLPARRGEAIAIAPTVPLALRGPAEVLSFAPSASRQAGDDLLERVQHLYADDALLHPLWAAALETRAMASRSPRQSPAELGALAARFLARADGPRIAMLETGGWDTHSGQAGRMAAQLKALDAMIAALREGLGGAWAETTVLVATEFGRTVAATAPAAPTTAPRRRRCCSAAPSPAAASSPTGPAWRRLRSTRDATSSRRCVSTPSSPLPRPSASGLIPIASRACSSRRARRRRCASGCCAAERASSASRC
jgi:uncharacterized protein (DUF1501 family)